MTIQYIGNGLYAGVAKQLDYVIVGKSHMEVITKISNIIYF